MYHPHEYTAALTRSLHDLCKTEDPDRFTAAVNGYGHAEHPVNQNADIQGMNRYFGWYEKRVQDILPWVEGLEKKYPWQRLMLTEYGADANIAHQTEVLGDALNWGASFYPETFQTKIHEYQWGVIAEHPYIIASYLWNMFDFASAFRNEGSMQGMNDKGLVTYDRKIKKDAFYYYKSLWSEEPVVHITSKRDIARNDSLTRIKVYSNCDHIVLKVNGKEYGNPLKNDNIYIWENVTLRKGENQINVSGDRNQIKLTADCKWILL